MNDVVLETRLAVEDYHTCPYPQIPVDKKLFCLTFTVEEIGFWKAKGDCSYAQFYKTYNALPAHVSVFTLRAEDFSHFGLAFFCT